MTELKQSRILSGFCIPVVTSSCLILVPAIWDMRNWGKIEETDSSQRFDSVSPVPLCAIALFYEFYFMSINSVQFAFISTCSTGWWIYVYVTNCEYISSKDKCASMFITAMGKKKVPVSCRCSFNFTEWWKTLFSVVVVLYLYLSDFRLFISFKASFVCILTSS